MAAPDQRSRRALILAALAVAGLTGMRLLLACSIDLAPDEAYYWQWSSDLALCYRDHPPLVAWMIRLGTSLAGDSLLGVRLVFVLSGIPAALLVFAIGRALGLRESASAISAVLASLLPAPAVASLLATPDTPLGICWLLAALALARLASGGSPRSWYMLGAALGLGMLAKHSALLLLPGLAAAVFLAPRLRADLRTAHPWLALLLALAIALPQLIADVGGESSSIALQLRHLSGDLPSGENVGPSAIPLRLVGLLGGQIGLLTPPIAMAAFVLALFRRPLSPAWKLVVLLLVLPMLAAFAASFLVHPEQNWAALGHPLAALLAIGAVALPRRSGTTANTKAWSAALLLVTACFAAALHAHALRPFLPLPADRDPVSRLHGWSALSCLAAEVRAADAVVCDNYGLAAELAWHIGRGADTPPIAGRDRSPEPPGGHWLLLDDLGDWSRAELEVSCDAVEPLRELILAREDGETIRRISVSDGRGCSYTESTNRPAR